MPPRPRPSRPRPSRPRPRPTSPIGRDGIPKLTLFATAGSAAAALIRDRFAALGVPYMDVDPDTDPRVAAYLDGFPDGRPLLPAIAVGAETGFAPRPDLATVDTFAAAAYPRLPIERPRLSPLGAGPEVRPVRLPDPAAPARARRAVAFLAHTPGCPVCAAYAEALGVTRDALGAAGARPVVVERGGSDDRGGAWTRLTLERLVAAPGSPGSLVRFVEAGVALLVLDRLGRPVQAAAGPEAGHLPDPATVADIVALLDAEASALAGGGDPVPGPGSLTAEASGDPRWDPLDPEP